MACSQPLLIHSDGTGTCTVPGCLATTLADAVLRHRMVVNCGAVLGRRCTVCHRPGPAGVPAPDTPGDRRLCEGSALVHVDLGVECSLPSCETDADRGSWLARHADIRSCSSLPEGCGVCAPGSPA